MRETYASRSPSEFCPENPEIAPNGAKLIYFAYLDF
jgi:hypothetical protein